MNGSVSQYVWRLANVAPAEVEAAFDRLRAGDAPFVVDVPGGRLELREDRVLRRPEGAKYFPLRQLRGVLHVGRLQSVDVDVELLPWSQDATEIGLRPTRFHRLVRPGYFDVAGAALERIVGAIEGFDREAVPAAARVAA